MSLKTCIRCGKRKPLTEYHKLSVVSCTGKLFSHRADCKPCRNAYEKARQAYHYR